MKPATCLRAASLPASAHPSRWVPSGAHALATALATLAWAKLVSAQPEAPALRIHFEVEPGAVSAARLDALLHAVQQRVTSELGRPLQRVTRSECELDCLHVVLGASMITERFESSAGGELRRTIDIGGDVALWPDAVALLAGNLVRDQSADLLDDLATEDPPKVAAIERATLVAPVATAAPPAVASARRPASAATVPPVPASLAPVPPAPRHVSASFGLLPVLSMDGLAVGRVQHDVSFDLVAGVSAGSRVFTISGAVDIELGAVDGLQLGGAVATAGLLRGVQLGGAVAIATEVRGTQIGGAAAAATEVRGLQLGGALAVATRSIGVQGAGAAVYTEGDAGLQLGGAVAIAAGDSATQLAGAINITGGVAHTQIAGAINIARRLEGAQVGVLNIAGKVDGVQIGVVNIGGGNDGVSLGLVNIVPGGRTDLEASVDSRAIGSVLLRHGSRRWHNVYGLAGQRVDQDLVSGIDDVWMYGLGFGPSWQRGATHLDLEAMAWQVNYGSRHSDDLSVLGQLRLSVARPLGPVTMVVGGAVNSFVSTDQRQPFLARSRSAVPASSSGDVDVKTWGSVFVGVRL